MTMYAPLRGGEAIAGPRDLVTAAVRCWRAARDQRAPTQPRLHAMLGPHWGILTPVFDSLMALSEAALGRPIVIGANDRSDDERLLLGWLDGSRSHRACVDCPAGTASALDCAICSTRIMIGLVFAP